MRQGWERGDYLVAIKKEGFSLAKNLLRQGFLYYCILGWGVG